MCLPQNSSTFWLPPVTKCTKYIWRHCTHGTCQSLPTSTTLDSAHSWTFNQYHLTTPLHLDMPNTCIYSYYGRHFSQDRLQYLPELKRILHTNSILLGDFNATTQPTDSTTNNSLTWPWLRDEELRNSLIDPLQLLLGHVPHTRTRCYRDTTSYIDRIYFIDVAARLFTFRESVVYQ